jgi:predicted phage terminase large subunit-like protein
MVVIAGLDPAIQDLKRDSTHAIGVDPDGDKVMRMNAQTARIEAGSVSLPRRASWLDEFRREIMAAIRSVLRR